MTHLKRTLCICVKTAAKVQTLQGDLPLMQQVKMFDKHLVHALIGGKDLYCGSAQFRVNLPRVNPLSVNLRLARGHGSLLLDP